MVGKAIVTTILGTAAVCGCSGTQTGMTRTSGALLERNTVACASVETACASDIDCCSLWCSAGRCVDREP